MRTSVRRRLLSSGAVLKFNADFGVEASWVPGRIRIFVAGPFPKAPGSQYARADPPYRLCSAVAPGNDPWALLAHVPATTGLFSADEAEVVSYSVSDGNILQPPQRKSLVRPSGMWAFFIDRLFRRGKAEWGSLQVEPAPSARLNFDIVPELDESRCKKIARSTSLEISQSHPSILEREMYEAVPTQNDIDARQLSSQDVAMDEAPFDLAVPLRGVSDQFGYNVDPVILLNGKRDLFHPIEVSASGIEQ